MVKRKEKKGRKCAAKNEKRKTEAFPFPQLIHNIHTIPLPSTSIRVSNCWRHQWIAAQLRVDSASPKTWKYDKKERTPFRLLAEAHTPFSPRVISLSLRLSLYNASAHHHPLSHKPSLPINSPMATSARPAVVPRGNAVYLHQLYRDPEPPPPPPPQEQLPFARRELMFYCGAVKWGVLFFLAVASFVMLMWMFFHPTFPLLSVASAAISNVSITAAGTTAECNVTLVLTNPNRHLTATYDRMKILLLYASQEVLLSQFHQPPIVQARRSRITFQTNLSFSGVNLGSGVLSAMKQDFDSGSLGFEMKIFSVIKYRSGKWKTNSHFMRAFCGGVSFAFTSSNRPGIFLNPYQECEVYLYSK